VASPWLPSLVRIQSIHGEALGVSTYELTFEEPHVAERYRFRAGQFNMLYVPGFGEAAISISSDPATPEALGHTIRVAGNVTQALARSKPGDQIALRGPFGSAWPLDECRGADLVLAAGGIGLAALRSAIYRIASHRDDYGRVVLLYGARTPAHVLYTHEFEDWRKARIEVKVIVDIGDADWAGQIGVVPALFHPLRLDIPRTRVLTCGPEIMMRFAIFEALAREIPAEHIYLSMERNMSCALGFCGHCQLGPAFICKDGPVFSYKQMERYMHFEDL
jgi:NAD(P)H-flavin reductase